MNTPDEARRREAVRTALQRQHGRAITVTDAMIDAVLAELPPPGRNVLDELAELIDGDPWRESGEARETRHQAQAVRQADQAAREAAEQAITDRARRNRGQR
jgi:hypothetical protein